MACIQTLQGISLDCQGSMGGLKSVAIANHSDVTSVKIVDDMITNIVLADGKKFKQYNFRKNTASMTSTLNADVTTGSSVSTDVVLSFLRQDTAKRVEMSALSLGELVMIVTDANGKSWYLGKDMPVTASAGTGESGTAFSDANRYEITLQDTSLTWPFEIRTEPETTGSSEYVNLDALIDKA